MSGRASDGGGYEVAPADRAEYSCFPPIFLTDQEVPAAEDEDLFVHRCIRFEGARLATNTAAVPFERFVVSLPCVAPSQKKKSGGHKRKALPADERAALLAEHPWLDEDDLPADLARRKVSTRRAQPQVHALAKEADLNEGIPIVAAPAEEVVEEAVPAAIGDAEEAPEVFDDARLAELRDELAWDESDDTYFFLHILGGRWTHTHKGVHADGAGGYARQGMVTSWCKRYGWPRQASFMFNKYGREGAVQLSKEYCRRSHFYFMLFVQSGTDDFAFTPEALQSYQEGSEWLDWLCSLGNEDPGFKRGLAMRAMAPSNPQGLGGAS